MRHVHIERLVEGECGLVVVVGVVDAGVAGVDEFALQSRGEFQDVADALGAAGGGAEAVVAVEFDIDGVGIIAPFLLSEEGTESRGSQGGGFVGTEILHGEDVVCG